MEYEIKAYRDPQGVILLRLVARDIADATRLAEAQGYRVVAGRSVLSWQGLFPRARRRFSVGVFSQELVGLLDAGLNIIESVDTLSRKARQSDARSLIAQLLARLREGLSFSQALESIPGAFPGLFIATMRSSERTGNLQQALERYLVYHRQLHAVRDKVVSASIYPLLLLFSGGLVLLFLLGLLAPAEN